MRRRWSMSGPNALFDAQGHFRRQRGLAVQKVGKRGAAHFQNLRRLRYVEAEASMTPVLIRSPGWGGFFMGIAGLLMVVDQVNIAGKSSELRQCLGGFEGEQKLA